MERRVLTASKNAAEGDMVATVGGTTASGEAGACVEEEREEILERRTERRRGTEREERRSLYAEDMVERAG